MESIKSIQENPFYKSFGLKHSVPSSSRNSILLETPEPTNRRSSNNDDDDIFEYRPVSGFVHKRMDKFSAISAKEELSNALLKRSTSLDENEPEQTKKRPLSSTGTILDTKSYLSGTSLSQRAKSVDGLNHVTHRQHQLHSSAVRSKQVGARQEKENLAISGALQADRDLSKKNIVIIEKTPPVYPVDRSTRVVGAADVCPEDELPKPNTVLTVRSIFENVASVSGSEYSRRRRSDAPLSPSSPSAMTPSLAVTINQASIKDQVSTQNLSPMTSPRSFSGTQTNPVLVSTGDSHSKTDHAKNPSSRSDHKTQAQTKRISQGYDCVETSSRENFGIITIDSSSSLPAVIDKADTETSIRQPALSQRSTVSVKPTISNQLAPQVKPVPLPPPASVSTSFTKSRPVVSVAPYKDKLDMTNTAQPVIIMSKSQLAPKREKPNRIKDYSQESNQSNEALGKDTNLNNNAIILQDTKNIYNERETIKSHKSSNKKEKSQNMVLDIDSTDSKSDQAKIVYTKNCTSIEIRSTDKSSSDKDISLNNKSETIEKSAKADSASNKQVKSKRKAPGPPDLPKLTENNKTLIHKSRQSPENFPNKDSSPSSHGQLQEKARNSETHSQQGTPRDNATAKEKVRTNDTPTSTELTLKKPSTENCDYDDPPVKGIPSILAQRLKQQKFDPSQVAVDVISSNPGRNNSLSTNSNETDSTSISKIDLNSVTISNGVKETEPENEIMIVRRRMEEKRSRAGSPTPIFNSSQLSKKNKNNQRQQETVPKLDLSGVVDDGVAEYQPPQRKIMPCNIVFVGENVKTSRSLLDKNRKFKVSVHFTDTKTDIFEYPREEVALERYLEEHPEETAEILILQDSSSLGGESEESADDVMIEEYLGHSDGLKLNTGLAHSGSLQSYKGRFHQDYDFGDILVEQPKKDVHPEPEVDPDKLMLRPAEEEDNTWSTSGTSDILF